MGPELAAESEVAGIAEPRDDITLARQFLVDGRHPERDTGREHLFEILDGITAGDGAYQVDMGRLAAHLDEFVVGHLDGGAGRQHRIGKDQRLAGDVGRRAVIGIDLEIVAFPVLAENREGGRLGVVEHVQQALVHRQARPEDGGDDQLRVGRGYLRRSQRRHDILDGIGQLPGYLIAEDLSHPLEVGTEAEAVFLDHGIAHFRDELVEDGVVVAEIDELHRKRI